MSVENGLNAAPFSVKCMCESDMKHIYIHIYICTYIHTHTYRYITISTRHDLSRASLADIVKEYF